MNELNIHEKRLLVGKAAGLLIMLGIPEEDAKRELADLLAKYDNKK